MAKYSKDAGSKVREVMHEKKKGTLKTGSGKKVSSNKQAIAIALSEARENGAKVPAKKSASKAGSKGVSKTAGKSSSKSPVKKDNSKGGAPKASTKKAAPKKSV
ncbi:MAG TPA: DUF6496 domain-containing protein [Flavisolibacter sp.]|nr:DUF6496 domain-containing protein [Flavisolibacter sp.]